ncbi:OmpA family protein [Treponema pedis]|uniref:OmpA family protein n=1 Tax=Treponema pedis TaxID=409322 RepID=UPI0003FB6ECF|nr:OmpA family protein [Treponema pedis]
MKKKLGCLILLNIGLLIFAQTEKSQNRITVTERADYSVYVNGKYIGLGYREAKFYLLETEQRYENYSVFKYEGEAFVTGKTRKNMKGTALPVDSILPIEFTVNTEPEREIDNPYQLEEFTKDYGYPVLRSFPVLPLKDFDLITVGEKWTGKSTIAVSPKADKKPVRIPVYSEFEYKGKTVYNGENVYYVQAVFGMRYMQTDELGDSGMIRSEGGRKADIYYDENNRLIFIREKIDEEFFYSDNTSIKHKGFLLHFYRHSGKIKGGAALQKAEAFPEKSLPKSENFDVAKTKRGTVLNLKNLNFIADKAELISGEEKKLMEIAEILKNSEADFFFVEGHTADIGKSEDEKKLSLERAKTITEILIKSGVSPEKLIYGGAGGTKPIASNDTEEGRAKNRRVEITIME